MCVVQMAVISAGAASVLISGWLFYLDAPRHSMNQQSCGHQATPELELELDLEAIPAGVACVPTDFVPVHKFLCGFGCTNAFRPMLTASHEGQVPCWQRVEDVMSNATCMQWQEQNFRMETITDNLHPCIHVTLACAFSHNSELSRNHLYTIYIMQQSPAFVGLYIWYVCEGTLPARQRHAMVPDGGVLGK
jgi:hypothetical protein